MTESKKPKRTLKVLELIPLQGKASKPHELIQIRGHEALSLHARRAITLLWHQAHRQGIEENKDYTIDLSTLTPAHHKGYEGVEEAIESLMTTLIIIRSPTGATRRVQVLGGNDLDDKNRPHGVLTYSFDKRLVELLQDSRIWGQISLPQLMALSSKYAVTLYEHVSQWTKLRYKTHQKFTLEEFREVIGLEDGKYKTFGPLNQQIIKPIVKEINALADFNLSIVPVRTGKKVTHVIVSWWTKTEAERKAAEEELQRPKVGRKARIRNKVEKIVPPPLPSDDPDLFES